MDNMITPSTCYKGHLGDLLVEAEQEVLKVLFTRIFGLHLVWVGYNALLPVLESSLVQHKIVLGDLVNPHLKVSKLISHPETLSIQPDSVDVVVLAHALELTEDPHRVLREAYRILRPEGQLIITGFNPISLLGVWYRVHVDKKLFTPHRIIDWCQLLTLELNKKEPFFYRPPLQQVGLMNKIKKLEQCMPSYLSFLAGGYCLSFVKRVVKLTTIRPHWRAQNKAIWGVETVQNVSFHERKKKKNSDE